MTETRQYRVVRLDRNHKRVMRQCFVRARDIVQAKEIGQAIMGGNAIAASEYHPASDAAFSGYVRQVQEA